MRGIGVRKVDAISSNEGSFGSIDKTGKDADTATPRSSWHHISHLPRPSNSQH